MAIAWTNHTHGRGPGFRSRRTLRLVRARKGPTPARARSYELTSEDLTAIEVGHSYGPRSFHKFNPERIAARPWHVRLWRKIAYYFAGGKLS